ncbi:MAG: ribonuclease HI [Chloroflexi bacterium]|nr:ribonuclease HI [Chloroflexota bacterium]
MLPEVVIYSDGACDPNPGPGGWAALLMFGERRKTITGSEPDTTNNRMELQAVIAALGALKKPCQVRLHTDSEYVQKGVTQHMARWKANGWRTSDKKSVANRDLWEALDQALQRHQVEWVWVKGHAGDPLNEEVDRLAVGMIPRLALPLDDREATHIFTGVSCLGASGPGGWAAVARTGDAVREITGREERTSANRLHLLAIATGLETVPESVRVHLYTPSDYAAQGAQQWLKVWAKHGWRTKDGQPVKHGEVWQAILAASEKRPVNWHCLKGEARPAESHRADELARQVARQSGTA